MDLKSTTVDGKLTNIISKEKYAAVYKNLFDNPSEFSNMSLEVQDQDGNEFILPFRGKNDGRPGIYPDGVVYFINYPKDIENSEYNVKNLDILDFSDVKNINQFLDKTNQVREMENNILSDPDEIFMVQIDQDDTPQMKVMKEAVNLKRCDLDKYALRAGANHLNNKRILRGNDITIKKMVEICEYLDMEIELTIRDKSGNIANPMGKESSRILTSEGETE